MTEKRNRLRGRVLPATAAALLLLLAVWLILAPAESRLGQVVKLGYVHGALVMVGLGLFTLAGLVGLIALVVRRPAWYRGVQAASLAALIVWTVYALSSMAVTGLTWGQIIAWNEPRVQASAFILLAAVAFALVSWLVAQPAFSAAVAVVMGVLPWVLVRRAEAIRHPLDPIGGSGSASIQGYYMLIVLTVAALAAVLVAWLWLGRERSTVNGEQSAVSGERSAAGRQASDGR
jgi:hypothetical protein